MTYLAARNLITGGAFGGAMGAAMLGLGTPTPPAALALGTRIGNFSISEEIGRGGSGTVYRAQRCDGAFAQTVALKVAHATSETRLRAQAERAALAQMQHPSIASIFDGGETADGDIWFAMDLVNGHHIDEYCAIHRLNWEGRVSLIAELCQAVQHAHDCGVIHRDIKPNNIIVGSARHLKLVDFGIAVDARLPASSASLSMTPEFASPEQFAGAPITAASDVYQVGRVLEELLLDGPKPPRHIAQNLAAIVARATHRSAEKRYQTASLLHADLQRAIDLRPALAQPQNAFTSLRFFIDRNKHLALFAAIFAVFALAAALAISESRLVSQSDLGSRRSTSSLAGAAEEAKKPTEHAYCRAQ